jgi:hypothetical protein
MYNPRLRRLEAKYYKSLYCNDYIYLYILIASINDKCENYDVVIERLERAGRD